MLQSYLLILLSSAATALAQGSAGGSQASCDNSAQNTWVYVGCYQDTNEYRHGNFPFLISSGSNDNQYYPGYTGSQGTGSGGVSISFCQTMCRGHGFRYAGLYYGTECWCSPTFQYPISSQSTSNGVGASPNFQQVADNQCNSQCKGVTAPPTEYCGGGAQIQVYYDPSYSNATGITAASNYLYLGCFSNVQGVSLITIKTTDTAACSAYCGRLGYSYSSRSDVDSSTNSYSCGCSTEVESGNLIPESSCNHNCDGTDAS